MTGIDRASQDGKKRHDSASRRDMVGIDPICRYDMNMDGLVESMRQE